MIADKMEVDCNVLHSRVENRVGTEIGCANVITVNRRCWNWDAKFLKKRLNPNFSCGGGNGSILSFDGGVSNRFLFLRAPRDRIVTKEHNVGKGGSAVI